MSVAGGLMNFFDPVHGRIDLTDTHSTPNAGIIRLLASPMLDRLRRIKLLGYASHTYPAADHSRYAHSLGTMQVMRRMLERVSSHRDLWAYTRDHLARFGDPPIENYAHLAQHMLVAALLQDVGELPYAQATARLLRPSDEVLNTVRTSTGMDASGWPSKDVFGTVSLHRDRTLKQSGLNFLFLVFLITGRCSLKPGENLPLPLMALRHMLDGEVDADRLDYVYRDAYHTVGGRGTSQAVIDSLIDFDHIGGVFSDPGPVSEFVTTRTALHTKVYFSAENRFRIVLLSTLIRGIMERDHEFKEVLQNHTWSNGLTPHEFQRLDDIWLIGLIQRLGNDDALKDRLNGRARAACEILLDNADYECYWVNPGAAAGSAETIPDNLFFDTYPYHDEGFCACANHSIRVKSGRYEFIENPMWLEDCCGPFRTVFGTSSPFERAGNVLVFKPLNLDPNAWNRIKLAIKEERLHVSLQSVDPFNPVPVPYDDTRDVSGFTGPSIFISFCWEDAHTVGRLMAALYQRRRRYFALYDPFHGTGGEPGENSVNAVMQADAVILLFSEAYVQRYRDRPNGSIARELKKIGSRREAEELPTVTFTTCGAERINDQSLFNLLGYAEAPYVGEPLANAPDALIDRAVDAALRDIDEHVRMRQTKTPHQSVPTETVDARMSDLDPSVPTYDVFLSHASSDKEHVRSLAEALKVAGISYWLDEIEIGWGDSITAKINDGLRSSRLVILCISEEFTRRHWTNAELYAAVNRQNTNGAKVVLPLTLCDRSRLIEKYPLLSDVKSLAWDDGVDHIVERLKLVLDKNKRPGLG